MAVIKMINREKGKTYALKAVIDYIQNPMKTENGLLVSAKDCLVECAYEQMLVTKMDFKQNTGRQYIHFTQSFSEYDPLDSKTAHEIGQKLLAYFDGFQGVVAIHTNTKQLHNHIVLNSVNFKTGRKIQNSRQDLENLKKFSDELCIQYNLSVVPKMDPTSRWWQTSGEYQAGDKSWKYMLAQDIKRCLEVSFNRNDFDQRLAELGLSADFGNKNIMFRISKEGSHRYGLDKELSCQNFKLTAYGDFSVYNINSRLDFNDGIVYLGKQDMSVLQDALLSVGEALFPDKPDTLQKMYFNDIDFEGLTKLEVEIEIAKLMIQKHFKNTMEQHRKAKAQRPMLVLENIADLMESLIKLWEKENNDYTNYRYEQDLEDEYER